MGDSGEGLIDAEARIQERMDERAAEREQRLKKTPIDPERLQELQSLRLAIAQLEQQAAAASHPVRREQLSLALKELAARLDALEAQKS